MQYAQEILFIILAICSVWLTIFLCVLFYQAIKILKNINTVVNTVTEKLQMISDAIEYIQHKMDKVSQNMGVFGKISTELFDRFVTTKLTSSLEEKIQKISSKVKRKSSKKKNISEEIDE